MAFHIDLSTVDLNLTLGELLTGRRKMREQHEKDEQEKIALVAQVKQFKLENELREVQNREKSLLSENARLKAIQKNSLAAEPVQQPKPRNNEQLEGRFEPEDFRPYPAPMEDIMNCLLDRPTKKRGTHDPWTFPEADAAIKYILAGNIDKPNYARIAKSLRENENSNAWHPRSHRAIRAFWRDRGRETTRCGRFFSTFQPIKPAEEYSPANKESRLQILKDFYDHKLNHTEQEAYFERGDLWSPRPHGDAVEDAKILAEQGQQGGASIIEGLNVYQYAYQEAYAMTPHLLLELDFPALERLLSERATMAFNPLITWAQCESIFESIDQHVTEWQKKTSSAKWSTLSESRQSKEKTQYAKKLEEFEYLERSGCKLWFHQFPVNKLKGFVTNQSKRPTRPTKPAKPAKLRPEVGTTSQQCAENSEELAAQNDGDPIKQEGTDTDDKEYSSGSEQQNIVEKEGNKEDVDHQSSSNEDEAKANLAETHGGSIAAGSTSRNHATGAAKSERTRHDPKQDDDGWVETSAIRNTKLSPRDAEERRSSHMESATEPEDDVADDSEIPTDGEITEKENDSKIRRRGGLGPRILYDSDASVSRRFRTLGVSNNPQDLNSQELSGLPASSRMVSSSPRGTFRSQTKRKGGISPGSSPNTKKLKRSSLRREAAIEDSEQE